MQRDFFHSQCWQSKLFKQPGKPRDSLITIVRLVSFSVGSRKYSSPNSSIIAEQNCFNVVDITVSDTDTISSTASQAVPYRRILIAPVIRCKSCIPFLPSASLLCGTRTRVPNLTGITLCIEVSESSSFTLLYLCFTSLQAKIKYDLQLIPFNQASSSLKNAKICLIKYSRASPVRACLRRCYQINCQFQDQVLSAISKNRLPGI
jgi:hypothetical protein